MKLILKYVILTFEMKIIKYYFVYNFTHFLFI